MNYGNKPKRSRGLARKLNRELINTNSVCDICGIKDGILEYRLTIDHIIPCAILKDLGKDFYDDKDNLRILCIKCNASRQARIDFGDIRARNLLKKYIQEYEDRL
jgi:5-methylcytosine-specific restriction endonuclease McrA